jgi:hypothetical protein
VKHFCPIEGPNRTKNASLNRACSALGSGHREDGALWIEAMGNPNAGTEPLNLPASRRFSIKKRTSPPIEIHMTGMVLQKTFAGRFSP